LFVLLNRTKTILYAVTKRAFPDAAAQYWFRALANQPPSVAPSSVSEATVPGRFAAKGITPTVQLKYRDYLSGETDSELSRHPRFRYGTEVSHHSGRHFHCGMVVKRV
jgi:hypothetical protein